DRVGDDVPHAARGAPPRDRRPRRGRGGALGHRRRGLHRRRVADPSRADPGGRGGLTDAPRRSRFCDTNAFMRGLRLGILDCIGGTSLVPLRRIVPANGARILLKLESENPTGSMKDRMALAMIGAAENDGRLKPGGAVVEYTGGSTGVSLSLVCAVKGHP